MKNQPNGSEQRAYQDRDRAAGPLEEAVPGVPPGATSTATVRAILTVDPTWSAYALADLQPAFAPYCRWFVGHSEQGAAVALIFTALSIPTLFVAGPTSAMMDAVAQIDLPDRIYITVREEHLAEIASRYEFGDDLRPMWRMCLPPTATVSSAAMSGLRRLTSDDSETVRSLYAHGGLFAPDAFEAYQVDNGVFFGVVDEGGELVASGGTHIVDWQHGIGAIGNMYTRPDRRGRGYGTAVLQAIVATLRADRVTNIVLNVDQRNQGACRLYEQFGFEVNCPYIEGIGRRRDRWTTS